MSLGDKVKFQILKIDAIESLIKRWDPVGCKTEKGFERSLADFLRQELSGMEIIQQYALARGRTDIMVDRKLQIELKYNLKTVNDCNRLIGQLDESKRWGGYVIVLLIGNTCPEMKHRIERCVKEVNNEDLTNVFLRMKVVAK